ncbi:hypothetical protein JXJ21_23340 [candidate division KSB1 bacterium]|nr:hypothetical protein [candidate division KSB1 bacterium]
MKRHFFTRYLWRIVLVSVCLIVIVDAQPSEGKVAPRYRRFWGHNWNYTYGLGAYRTYGSAYVDLRIGAKPIVISPDRELEIFRHILREIYLPKYILLQLTLYPLSTLSSFLETDHATTFNQFEIYDGFNVLRSLSADFEEPYAASVFLGNIIGFKYEGKESNTDTTAGRSPQVNSILSGVLFSGGHWHIQDNIRIQDEWLEILFLLTGQLNVRDMRNVVWDLRAGYRLHRNRLVTDVAVISVLREHTEWEYRGLSPFRNSYFQTAFYLPIGSEAANRPLFTRQLLVFGKKVPMRLFKRKVMLKLGVGILWEQTRLFNREQWQFGETEHRATTWLVQPGLEL